MNKEPITFIEKSCELFFFSLAFLLSLYIRYQFEYVYINYRAQQKKFKYLENDTIFEEKKYLRKNLGY